jgi:hypothetical protein
MRAAAFVRTGVVCLPLTHGLSLGAQHHILTYIAWGKLNCRWCGKVAQCSAQGKGSGSLHGRA